MLLIFACVGTAPDSSTDDSTADSSITDTGERDPIRDLDPDTLPATRSPCRDPILVRVTDVVDGDTAYVQWADTEWKSEKVRFVGIDTPELSSDDCWADEAHDAARAMLEGELVWMTFDAECEDTFDRTLGYLWKDADTFANLDLVSAGHGWAFPYDPNTHFESEIQSAESQARSADRGMWADCY